MRWPHFLQVQPGRSTAARSRLPSFNEIHNQSASVAFHFSPVKNEKTLWVVGPCYQALPRIGLHYYIKRFKTSYVALK